MFWFSKNIKANEAQGILGVFYCEVVEVAWLLGFRMSNGCAVDLIAGCRIGVDYWSSRATDLQACFLTHAHTDHTHGLSEKWAGPAIHCTEQTKQFIVNKWPKLETKAVIVRIGDTLEMVLRGGDGGHITIQVTPIDACHCPVSAMVKLNTSRELTVIFI